jgi:hypothetical protein
MCALARHLGCTPAALYRHVEPHDDGYRLVSAPHPANVGRPTWTGRDERLLTLIQRLARNCNDAALAQQLAARIGDNAAAAVLATLQAEQG